MSCIFCMIANGEIPSKTVYEDDICTAIFDLSQTTDGHTLVLPKKHFNNILDVDDEVLAHMIKVAKKIANDMMANLGCKGVNILSNANAVAGQSVMHFHIHIIPRYDENDGIEIRFTDREKIADADATFKKLLQK